MVGLLVCSPLCGKRAESAVEHRPLRPQGHAVPAHPAQARAQLDFVQLSADRHSRTKRSVRVCVCVGFKAAPTVARGGAVVPKVPYLCAHFA